MLALCRKADCYRNLERMAERFPQHYNFVPRTYVIPARLPNLLAELRRKQAAGTPATFIIKPSTGAQGRGIRLVQTAELAEEAVRAAGPTTLVACAYIDHPMLVHGLKFDLRLYVLITSCQPLQVYLFDEGLVRFCTEAYAPPSSANLTCETMHLTNYAINKHSERFGFNTRGELGGGEGSKWTLAALRDWFAANNLDWTSTWASIQSLVVKSVLSVTPLLQHSYRSVVPLERDTQHCFEILGYDVLLDHCCRPWLLEVNHSPSFHVDTPLDSAIKTDMLGAALRLVAGDGAAFAAMRASQRRDAAQRLYPGGAGIVPTATPQPAVTVGPSPSNWQPTHQFMQVYPADDAAQQALYDTLLQGAQSVFEGSFLARVSSSIRGMQCKAQQAAGQPEQKTQWQRKRHVKRTARPPPPATLPTCPPSPSPPACHAADSTPVAQGRRCLQRDPGGSRSSRPRGQPCGQGPLLRLPVVDVLQHVLESHHCRSRHARQKPSTQHRAPLRGRRSANPGTKTPPCTALPPCETHAARPCTQLRIGGRGEGVLDASTAHSFPSGLAAAKENWGTGQGLPVRQASNAAGYDKTKALLVRLLQTQWTV